MTLVSNDIHVLLAKDVMSNPEKKNVTTKASSNLIII